jgi:uncharacterized membrane protein YfcA
MLILPAGVIFFAALFAGISSIFLHGAFGNITAQTLMLGLFGIPATLLGTYLGLKIFDRTGKGFISWILIIFTALSGTSLLLFTA